MCKDFFVTFLVLISMHMDSIFDEARIVNKDSEIKSSDGKTSFQIIENNNLAAGYPIIYK